MGSLLNTASIGYAWSEPFQHSYALVLGIDEYSGRWVWLRNACADATDVAHHLESLGFAVLRFCDGQATKAKILTGFSYLARTVEPSDRVVVFYAGHGYTRKDEKGEHGYLVPSDGDEDPSSLISLDELETLSTMLKAGYQLFITDSCYSGLLRRETAIPPVEVTIEQRVIRGARQVIAAGTAGQEVVDEDSTGHSLFTGMLLAGLEGRADANGDGSITVSELIEFLRLCASTPKQTPTLSNFRGHDGGEFFFKTPADAKVPADRSYLAACVDRNLPARVQPCDINGDGVVDAKDIQAIISQALGTLQCRNDLTGLRVCAIEDVRRMISAALGSKCFIGTSRPTVPPKQ